MNKFTPQTYVFCTNKTTELSPNRYEVATVLIQGTHDSLINSYLYQVQNPNYNIQTIHNTTEITTTEIPKPDFDPNIWGCPNNWIINFSTNPPTLEQLNEQDELSRLKPLKKEEIKQSFLQSQEKGSELCYCTTTVLNPDPIVVDASRIDKDNLQTLLNIMTKTNQATTYIKDYYNKTHLVTKEELDTIVFDLETRGLSLYQIKWTLDYQIQEAQTKEQLSQICWTLPNRKRG